MENAEGMSLESKGDVTHWRHVRYQSAIPPWTVREEPGRGFVAYATRTFRMGEKICSEFPTVWIHGHHPFDATQIKEIEERVAALDDEDKTAFYAMANVFPEFPPAVGIFMTNCFDMTDSIYGTSCAMYLALARLNHSCYPNAQQTHIPTTTEEVLYAARDISEGEEINDCYIDLRRSREHRRQELQEYYRFDCMCAACSIGDDNLLTEENTLRQRTGDIADTILSLITASDNDEEEESDNSSVDRNRCIAALTTALQLKQDLTRDDNNSSSKWCVRYLPELYISIAQLCESMAENHKKESLKKKFYIEYCAYLQQALALTQQLQGDTSPEYERLKSICDEKLAQKPVVATKTKKSAAEKTKTKPNP
jgi:hypothetical protein